MADRKDARGWEAAWGSRQTQVGLSFNALSATYWGFHGNSEVKKKKIHLSMQEMWVRSLDGKDPLKKKMATPIPVFLPGKSHGQRSLVDYSPWGHRESDMT